MSFAQRINQWFQRKPVAAAVSDDNGMGDTVVQDDMYDGALNSVQGAPSLIDLESTNRADELISLPLLGKATVASTSARCSPCSAARCWRW